MQKYFITFIFTIIASCSSFQKSDQEFISFFPTDADIIGWKVGRNARINMNYVPEGLENVDISNLIISIYNSTYKEVSGGNNLNINIIKTNSNNQAFRLVRNSNNLKYKTLEGNIYNFEKKYIFRLGNYAIYFEFDKYDENNYTHVKRFKLFFSSHIPHSNKIYFLESGKFSSTLYSFDDRSNILGSDHYFLKYTFNKTEYEMDFLLPDSIYMTKTKFMDIIRNNKDFTLSNTENYSLAFIKRNDVYIFAGAFQKMVFIIYPVVDINTGKNLARDIYYNFRGVNGY